jgi:type I restriction enzyme S subunit
MIQGFRIPVPPIDVQQDIVATLDAMQSLIDGLRSERDARRRQFAYYRDKLLAFSERG